MVWFCNPAFKGLGIIPEAFEKLDDLVQARRADALRKILIEAFASSADYKMPDDQARQFADMLQTPEELADWCWRVLKVDWKAGNQQKVLDLIARHP